MANGRIKGITIELNGDTTKLNKALSSSEKAAQESAKALKEIERNLKFNPGNSKLVEQQQRNLAQAIEATKEKLKVLQDADGQMKQQLNEGKISIDQYEAFQREIITTEGQLANYERRLGSSQSEQQRFETATQSLSTIFEKSGTSIDDFATILGEETVEAFKKGEGSSEQMEAALQKLGDELLGTGGDSDKLKEDLDRLGEGVSFDQLQKEAKDSGAEFGQLGESAEGADKSIKGIKDNAVQIAGLDAAIDLFGKLKDAIGEAMGSIMDAWGKIDDGQDTIIAKTGASGEAAEQMGQIFTDVYTSMPAESQAVGDAIGELNTQFGLQGDELEGATRKMLQYAEVNGSDVTQATQSAKAAMDQFGKSGEDLSGVLDVVTKAGQDTGVNTEKLLDTVAKGAPALQGMGLSFEESVVAMSQFEQSGIDGSKALSYLTKAQSSAAKDGKSLSQALSEFSQVANSSASDTDKLNAASELFGAKGGAMMLKAAQDGHLNFDKLKESVAQSGGAVENTYNDMLDPIDNVTVAQHNLDTILGDIGSTIQEAAAPAIETLVDFLQKLSTWFQNLNPNVKTAIVVILGIVTAFLGVIAVIATIQAAFGMLGPIITNITGIFTGLGGALSGIFAFVAANPIVLLIAAIVAAVVLLVTHWDQVKAVAQAVWDKIVEVWNGILAFIGPILQTISETISNVWNGIKDTAANIWEGIKNTILTVWEVIKNIVTTYIDTVKNVITTVFNVIKGVVETVWNTIKTVILTVWEVIKNIVTTCIDTVKNVITTVFNTVKSVVTNIWNGIKAVIENVWNGIKTGVSSAVNSVKDTVSNVFNAVKSTVSSIWDGIKNGISSAVNSIKNTVSNVFNSVKSTVSSIWSGIQQAISEPINRAKDLVRKAIDSIKGFFNFKFSWPHIPLPHFSFSGSINPFSGNFPPRISLDWYKQGGIFDRPSVIGVGEAGSEAVVPTHKLDDFFTKALERINTKEDHDQPFVINVQKMEVRNDMDIYRVAEELDRLRKRELRARHV